MRGRTNVPPRMGGIVNGVVTECVVSEADGIKIGDYVQLVEGTGVRDTSMKTCNSDWMYGPFVLSDGTIASIYCDHSTDLPQVRQTTVGISGFVVESQITVLDISELGTPTPSYTVYDNMYVLELEQNKFLLQISDMSSGGFAIIQYNGSSWTVTPLTTSNFTMPNSPYLAKAKMCKISSTKVALAYRSMLYIAQLSGTTLTFGSVTTITVDSADCLFMEYINGYLLISWLGELFTYSISETSSTAVSSLELSENPTRFNTAKLTSNKLLMLNGSNQTYSYYPNPDGYVYATILTVNSDGTMSYVKNTTALHYDITYPYDSLIDEACPYVFEDGRILAVALLGVRSGSSSSYSYQFVSVWTSIGEYDADTNTVEFPILEKFNSSGGLNSSNSHGQTEFFLSPIEVDESGLMYFVAGGSGNGLRSTSQFILKVEQTSIVALSELPIVKKYVSRINGVAKTGGANGSVIEVYSPSSLL